MRLLVAIILTALLSFVAGIYLPWWGIAIAAFISILIVPLRSGGQSFLAGFLGVFLLWALLAWWIDLKNEHVLSTKVAAIFPLGGSSLAIISITALIGALVGGFAAMSGSYLRTWRR